MSEIRLSWSGTNVTVTEEYLDETRVSINMEQSRAFRDWRVPRAIELAQRNLEALEADNASEEIQATLAMYIGELYIWQEDGELVEPEVKAS
ncbi:MAG: hypothetical protein MK218_04610 [Gammaproteobacteria bacterium]|jgi:hypothetical protein|nr:hypothetical protein [Gammaproteobacteria bacterium]|tara:strand:- start:1386 stop:1661 length:276 start_codon:yes stop_codon:yes gene_type:complete